MATQAEPRAKAMPYATWMRAKGQSWRVIASGRTFAESESKADAFLRTIDDVGPGVETFTARQFDPLPCGD
jgi:hypothetical protein